MSGRAWQRGMAAAVAFVAVVVVTGDLPAADEGMWTFANPPLTAAQSALRIRRPPGVARSSPPVEHPLQRRRIGFVRRAERPRR